MAKQLKKSRESGDQPRLKIGLALGGGGARGWAHIEVIRALESMGIKPDIVAGTSIGALVGGAYAAQRLDDLAEWLQTLRWQDVVGFLDVSLSGGFIEGKKLFRFFREHFEDVPIERLSLPYAAIAAYLDNGQEVWLREGSLLDAIRASIAVPGFFTPAPYRGRWLVDGGVTNPVPVSVCRALGADYVIAVSVGATRHTFPQESAPPTQENNTQEGSVHQGLMDKIKNAIQEGAASILGLAKNDTPSMLDVVADSIEIMQLRIMRSRMAGDPPDVIISPHMTDVGFLEFHRVKEAMQAGKRAVEHRRQELETLLASSRH